MPKIPTYPSVTSLTGTEELICVQSNLSKKLTPNDIVRPINITRTAAIALTVAGTVKNGQTYNIANATGFDRGVIVTGMPYGKSFSIEGNGGFLNPDHQNVGVYTGVFNRTGIAYITNRGVWNESVETATITITPVSGVDPVVGDALVCNGLGAGIPYKVIQVIDPTMIVIKRPIGSLIVAAPFDALVHYTGGTATLVSVTPNLNAGDVVIWDGKHYQCLNNDTYQLAHDNPTIDVGSYALLEKAWANVGYIETWDIVEYDIVNDWLQYRQDTLGNQIRCSNSTNAQFFYLDHSPVVDFKWGMITCINNKVNEGWFPIINSISGDIFNNTFDLGSVFANNIIGSSAEFIGNTLGSGAYINNNTMGDGSMINYNILGAGAHIDGNDIQSSAQLSYNTLGRGASIIDNNVGISGAITNNVLEESASIMENLLVSSALMSLNTLGINARIENNSLQDGAYFTHNTLGTGAFFVANGLDIGAYFLSNTLGTDAYISSNTLGLSVYITSNNLRENADISFNTFSSSTGLTNNTLGISSTITNNTLNISAVINHNILFTDAYISSNILEDGSYFYGNILNNSAFLDNISIATTKFISNNIFETGAGFTTNGWVGGLTQDISNTTFEIGAGINVDLSSATIIYGTYPKHVIKQFDNSLIITYYTANAIVINSITA